VKESYYFVILKNTKIAVAKGKKKARSPKTLSVMLRINNNCKNTRPRRAEQNEASQIEPYLIFSFLSFVSTVMLKQLPRKTPSMPPKMPVVS